MQAYRRNNNMNPPVPPELMSLAAYVAEDGLVGHHWEERPLVLRRLYSPVQRNARARKKEWEGWGEGRGEGIRDFWNSIYNHLLDGTQVPQWRS